MTIDFVILFSMLCFPAPLALLIGIVAVIDIRKHPEKHGMGRAIFGIVAGLIGSGLLLFALVATFLGRIR